MPNNNTLFHAAEAHTILEALRPKGGYKQFVRDRWSKSSIGGEQSAVAELLSLGLIHAEQSPAGDVLSITHAGLMALEIADSREEWGEV